jgi:hypothetical protein
MTSPAIEQASKSTRTETQVRAKRPLNVARAADREAMARRLEQVIREAGATVERDPLMTRDREIWLNVTAPQGLAVTIDLDGDSRQQRDNVFVLGWHIGTGSTAQLSEMFGRAAGGGINPHHFAKCTAVSYGWPALLQNVRDALYLANTGEAFK